MGRYFLRLVYMTVMVITCNTSLLFAVEVPSLQRITGEIGWIDMVLGKLELHQTSLSGTQTSTYRITPNETRVTDTSDKQFLNLDDLRAGQYVTIEASDVSQDVILSKIIVDPVPVTDFQQAFGVLNKIDVNAGVLEVEEKVRVGQSEQTKMTEFVFDPKTIVVMRSPSKEPVELFIKPMDVVKVEYVESDNARNVKYITLYSPVRTKTTTTTTTIIEE